MPYPTAIVEIGFGSGPYLNTVSWTDVTAYTREITTRRGRSDEFQDFGSGSATVILDNRDRRFDPLNASSPYAPNLKPRTQIRVRASNTVGAVTTQYDVFRGFISGWPVSITEAGFDSTVTLECFDALGLLNNEEIPEDLADSYIRSLSPRHYWPLTDPIDPDTYLTAQLADYGSAPQTLKPYATFRTANSEGLAPGLPNTALQVSETEFVDGWIWSGPPLVATVSTFVGWYVQGAGNNSVIIDYGTSSNVQTTYDATSSIFTVSTYDGTTQRNYSATIYLDITLAHHLAIVLNSNATLNALYIDGQLVTTTATSTAFAFTRTEELTTGPGKKQQIAIFTSQLTATQIQTIYRLGRNIFTETSAARFNRIISYTPFPGSLTSPPASPTASVAAFTTGGPSVSNELEVVSDSEGGNLYVNKSGVVTMTGRNEFATGTSLTSQATIGTTGISIGIELDYRIDAENMRNTLAIGFSGDGSVEVSNSSSVTDYGVAGGSITTQLPSQQDAQTLGNFLIGFAQNPAVVISPVEVNVSAVAADWATVLGLELLNRITLTVQPRTGAAITTPQLIQSIEHRVIPGQWSTTLNGSVRFTNPFIIGSSLLGGPDLLL